MSKKRRRSTYALSVPNATPNSKGKISALSQELLGESKSEQENFDPNKIDWQGKQGWTPQKRRKITIVREAPINGDVATVYRISGTPFKPESAFAPLHSLIAREKLFGPYTITAKDFEHMPDRKSVRSQFSVFRKSASKAFEDFISNQIQQDSSLLPKEIPSAKQHWCHLIAFSLLAGTLDTQVQDNLSCASDKCNYTMKHYESYLKKKLQSGEFKKLIVTGRASEVEGSLVSTNISIDVIAITKDNKRLNFSFDFDSFREKSENSIISKLLFVVIDHYSAKPPAASHSKSSQGLFCTPTKENKAPNDSPSLQFSP